MASATTEFGGHNTYLRFLLAFFGTGPGFFGRSARPSSGSSSAADFRTAPDLHRFAWLAEPHLDALVPCKTRIVNMMRPAALTGRRAGRRCWPGHRQQVPPRGNARGCLLFCDDPLPRARPGCGGPAPGAAMSGPFGAGPAAPGPHHPVSADRARGPGPQAGSPYPLYSKK